MGTKYNLHSRGYTRMVTSSRVLSDCLSLAISRIVGLKSELELFFIKQSNPF